MNKGRARENPGVTRLRGLLERYAVESGALSVAPHGSALLVRHGGASSLLRPVWAGEGYPADLEAVWDRVHDSTEPGQPVLVAREFSGTSRQRLRERGLSWLDDSAARVMTPHGLVVLVDGGPAVHAPRTSSVFRWAEASGAVAEHLLVACQGRSSDVGELVIPAVVDLAERLDVSGATISRALRGFDEKGWTAKRGAARGVGSRRVLVDPAGLLSSWAAWHTRAPREVVSAHAVVRDPQAFTDELARSWRGRWWALTGQLALEHRAPFATNPAVVDVYLETELLASPVRLQETLDLAGLRRVDAGARVRMIAAGPYLRRLTPGGVEPVEVSDIRLYGDLLREGVRGEDAADHLRRHRIGF